MQKHKLLTIAVGLSLAILPTLAYAQEPTQEPTPGSNMPTLIRNQLKARAMENEAVRNDMLGSGSTTRPEMRDRHQNNQGQNDRKELRVDIFRLQQGNVVKEFTRALDNLKQVRTRIEARVTKAEQDGHDMTNTKALLSVADTKIASAQTAIDAFASFIPPTATPTITSASTAATTSTSTNVRLDRPRQIGASAIQAVKDAKDALNKVVVSIAQAMGLKLLTK